jgi:hypothetical protein
VRGYAGRKLGAALAGVVLREAGSRPQHELAVVSHPPRRRELAAGRALEVVARARSAGPASAAGAENARLRIERDLLKRAAPAGLAGFVGEQGGRMKRPPRDEEREQRITMEVVVDAYTPEEQAMGWYYSLEDRLNFPFVARCITERSISPLLVGDEVEVVGMAPEEECQHEMFVVIPWERRTLAVPLAQLQGIAVDEQTRQVIDDWQYWVAQGYEL